MRLPDVSGWRREHSHSFAFVDRNFDPDRGRIRLRYQLDDLDLVEEIVLPATGTRLPAARQAAVEAALDLLHWTAGVSYWKAACPSDVTFSHRQPNRWQAAWLTRLYRAGLAEFAFRNGLDSAAWPSFEGAQASRSAPVTTGLSRRTLVPMGGGKDSLVAWSRLLRVGERPDSVQIGRSVLIRQIGERLSGRHWVIERRLDPQLAELNALGALNGHVPVTAINSAILVLAALVLDYDRVAFANERSADEASLIDEHGHQVNHQFSKSYEFEQQFDQWVRRYVEPGLQVFSILRRDRELAICRDFAALEAFHPLFSSCNRNFHLDGPRTSRWCGACPKCHFVFLGLAPFMTPTQLQAIFGRDLLAQADQVEGFAALLALDGAKPFECVGEADEARAVVLALGERREWRDHEVVQALLPRLTDIEVPTLDQLCQPLGPSLIPEEWVDAA
jgi:UDP-N-acetyl-alpha-D-muramoyl-L-alanyl-L-glutamate epimerase